MNRSCCLAVLILVVVLYDLDNPPSRVDHYAIVTEQEPKLILPKELGPFTNLHNQSNSSIHVEKGFPKLQNKSVSHFGYRSPDWSSVGTSSSLSSLLPEFRLPRSKKHAAIRTKNAGEKVFKRENLLSLFVN